MVTERRVHRFAKYDRGCLGSPWTGSPLRWQPMDRDGSWPFEAAMVVTSSAGSGRRHGGARVQALQSGMCLLAFVAVKEMSTKKGLAVAWLPPPHFW